MKVHSVSRYFVFVFMWAFMKVGTSGKVTTTEITEETMGWVTEPERMSVSVGSPFMLRCELSNPGTVIWTHNGRPLGFGEVLFRSKGNERYSLSTVGNGSVLAVSDADKNDSGQFKCQATDVPDLTHIISVSDEPTLDVTCSWKFGSLRWQIDAFESNPMKRNTNKITIQRSRRNREDWEDALQVNASSTTAEVKLIVRDQKFRILWQDHLGVYWISNTSPETRCSAPQDVPLSNPKDVQASLQEINGYLKLTLYWTVVPENHWMGDGFLYIIEYKAVGSNVWERVEITDTLQYKYEVEVPRGEAYFVRIHSANDLGLCKQESTTLTLTPSSGSDSQCNAFQAADFISKPRVVFGAIGELVTLDCEHESQYDYAFVWFKNSNTSTPIATSGIGYSITTDEKYMAYNRNLQIRISESSDSDTYTCQVKMNPVVSLSHLVVVGDAGSIYNVDVTCNESTAVVTWNYCSGSLSNRYTRYGYEETCEDNPFGDMLQPYLYNIKNDYNGQLLNNYQTRLHNRNQTKATITLRPNSYYEFLVNSVNIYGESVAERGNTDCSTRAGIPWKNPDHVTSFRNSKSITVLWEELEQYEYHGQNFLYRVQISSGNFSHSENVTRSGYKLLEFDPDLTYSITVTSSNEVGDCEEPATPVISYPPEVKEAREEMFPSFYPSNETSTIIHGTMSGNVTLPCNKVDGSSFMWRKRKSDIIVVMNGVVILEQTRLSVANNGDLTINNIQKEDFGYYECISYHGNQMSAYLWKLLEEEKEDFLGLLGWGNGN